MGGAVIVKWLQRALIGRFGAERPGKKWPVAYDFGTNVKQSSDDEMKAAAWLRCSHTANKQTNNSKQGDEV